MKQQINLGDNASGQRDSRLCGRMVDEALKMDLHTMRGFERILSRANNSTITGGNFAANNAPERERDEREKSGRMKPETLRIAFSRALDQRKTLLFQERLNRIIN